MSFGRHRTLRRVHFQLSSERGASPFSPLFFYIGFFRLVIVPENLNRVVGAVMSPIVVLCDFVMSLLWCSSGVKSTVRFRRLKRAYHIQTLCGNTGM
ncbi:hypothetical protein BDQ17DRAFT_1372943 [Cyathus striatus]|nr:hypothetical protein BDQ17DRAFT_1372943 [Cyathus striatus]